MAYNNNFSMKDFFMNKEMSGLFPQFTKKDGLKNVYSYEWVEKKVADYIKRTFNGHMQNGDIVIKGKFKEKFKEIKAMKGLIESMFNNMPAITKNIRKNTKVITPFQSLSQLKEIKDPRKKIMVMEIVLDNLTYNPNFQSLGRVSTDSRIDFYKRQRMWMNTVGYDKITNN